jgi:hypothetical protein
VQTSSELLTGFLKPAVDFRTNLDRILLGDPNGDDNRRSRILLAKDRLKVIQEQLSDPVLTEVPCLLLTACIDRRKDGYSLAGGNVHAKTIYKGQWLECSSVPGFCLMDKVSEYVARGAGDFMRSEMSISREHIDEKADALRSFMGRCIRMLPDLLSSGLTVHWQRLLENSSATDPSCPESSDIYATMMTAQYAFDRRQKKNTGSDCQGRELIDLPPSPKRKRGS